MSLNAFRMRVPMLRNRGLVVSAFMALMTLLSTTNAMQAQSYFLGYYYPDENRFHSDHNSTEVVSTSYGLPLFMQQTYKTPQPTRTTMFQPAPPAALPANIHLVVPASQAKVYFETYATKATGVNRDFVTPAIEAGSSFKYHVTVTWNESGQDLTIARDVAVTPGQSATVDFTEAANALRKSRGIVSAPK